MEATIQRTICVILGVFLLTLAPLRVWSQDLHVIEKQMLEAIGLESDRALGLLEKSVEINSGTMNFEGVRAVGAL